MYLRKYVSHAAIDTLKKTLKKNAHSPLKTKIRSDKMSKALARSSSPAMLHSVSASWRVDENYACYALVS